MSDTLGDLPRSTPISYVANYSAASPMPLDAMLFGVFEGSGIAVPVSDIVNVGRGPLNVNEIVDDYEVQESDLGGLIVLQDTAINVDFPAKLGEAYNEVYVAQMMPTNNTVADASRMWADNWMTDGGLAPWLLYGDIYKVVAALPSIGTWAAYRIGEDTYARKIITDGDITDGEYYLRQDDDRKTLYIDTSVAVAVRLGSTDFHPSHRTAIISHQVNDVTVDGDDYTVTTPDGFAAQLAGNRSAVTLDRDTQGNWDLIGQLAEAP